MEPWARCNAVSALSRRKLRLQSKRDKVSAVILAICPRVLVYLSNNSLSRCPVS